ncbi:MAG: hypothetical protein IPJ65_19800 [Archangiaceae bacterium]|nr:hypothetical protein [Archangiaceae bacterium]
MPIRGKVYIVPDAAKRSWRMVVHNTGDGAIGVTNNIFPKGVNHEQQFVHDDHVRYGHGLPVNPGGVSFQEFQEGAPYNNQPIREGSTLRVGLRGLAWQAVELPPLGSDPIELDLADFVWYGGNAQSSRADVNYMDQYASQARNKLSRNVANGAQVLAEIEALMNPNLPKVKGQASITAVPNDRGQLSHWEVRFKNASPQPFIGTVAFDGANKNDGIGLESMALPAETSEAMQRIEALGNYGATAKPGAGLRLGVRGYGYLETQLPDAGTVEFDVSHFTKDSSSFAEEYFDPAAVRDKQNEKRDRVQFWENGKAINDELKPKTLHGDEARAKSTFDAPGVSVEAVEDGPETPGGGWVVTVKNPLPKEDDRGELGFVATLRLGPDGWDPAVLKPKKLSAQEDTKTWFIPRNSEVNGVAAKTGTKLIIGTRGLGWVGTVALPAKGKSVDAAADFDKAWGFREDQYNRRNLEPEFWSRCRD